jgi:3-hydroxyacyl-CoA dehydrogenase
MADFGEKILGKGIVWAKDTPNFVGNRIGVQGMVKAMQLMIEEGLSIPEADALFGPVMGRPKTAMFKTSDLVGLDTMGHVAKNTYDLVEGRRIPRRFRHSRIRQQNDRKGAAGQKDQGRFLQNRVDPDWKPLRKVIDPATLEYAEWEKPDFPCLTAAKKAKTLPEKMQAVVYGDDKGARSPGKWLPPT